MNRTWNARAGIGSQSRLPARKATTSTATASLKLNRDPLGSQFLNDSADASERLELSGRAHGAGTAGWFAFYPAPALKPLAHAIY